MTREEIRNNILSLTTNNILAELATSLGKSKIALDFMNEKQIKGKILIVIPRLVLPENWEKEFDKWGYSSYLPQVTFTTYISLPKYAGNTFDLIIFDECHHLTERAREAVPFIHSNYNVLLSATVKKTMKEILQALFPGLECFKISMKEAIDNNLLPNPKVYLVPLKLDNSRNSEVLVINPRGHKPAKTISFKERFIAKKDKKQMYKVICSQQEYYEDMSGLIKFYKKKYEDTNDAHTQFRFLHLAKERLKWLSSLKNGKMYEILHILRNRRTITFCGSVEQTERLGKYCINYENQESKKYLKDFNEKKIKHITACDMLNEGINLTECQIGIFVHINSSDIALIQKQGRILRHSNPVFIILYYENTREQEIIDELKTNYNPELITVVKNLEQLDDINNR